MADPECARGGGVRHILAEKGGVIIIIIIIIIIVIIIWVTEEVITIY